MPDQVRAVWDEEHSKWWFSAIDIVRAINDEEDYKKSRNYWKYLKGKMASEGIELVSVTNHFKFEAPDGKQRASDALDATCVQTLAKHYPANRANAFLDWFTYSDNTIDGQSKKKAYDLFESGLLDSLLEAMSRSVVDATPIKALLQSALTDKIDDRETFMKGIDYSYYYEQTESRSANDGGYDVFDRKPTTGN